MIESATELAARIRRREISSEEAVRAAFERIDAVDPLLAAFTDLRRKRALAEARRKDRERSDLPFHGVPVGIKDLNLVRGTYTRFGSRAYRWLRAPIDDMVTRSVRAAGFVVVGKLSTSEFGALPITETDIHPPTRNPWSPDRTAGGSSGGSGAAVAAGMLPIAHGSDGGGSIRIPAALCGLYGFKASRGVVPNPIARIDRVGLAVEGSLATTVDDAHAFVEVLCGRPLPPVEVPRRLRIQVSTAASLRPAEAPYVEATLAVAKLLAELGHDVVEAPAVAGNLEEFLPMWTRMSADVPILLESTVQPVTRWLRAQGRDVTHDRAKEGHAALAARVDAWWGDVDLAVTPTIAQSTPKVGEFRGLPPDEHFRAVAPLGQFTAPFNVSGQPAASIPAGLAPDGLPIGVQIVGRKGADALVLAVSRALERAMPWRHRIPAVARR